jgi:hypothetical protein
MTKKIQSAFPAIAAFHAAAAASYQADPQGTSALLDACKASELERSLRTDGSFEHFMFAITQPSARPALRDYLPNDGFLDEDRAQVCLDQVEDWRRPSDIGIKAACHRIGVPGVSPEALIADVVCLGEIVESYVPRPQMRM